MKPNFKLRSFLAGSVLIAMLGAAQGQVQYYYDNVAGAGFGSAGNTWGTSSVISTDSTGTAAAANTATTTADTLNLGTSTLGLGNGTITVVAGGRSIGSIVRGSASSSGIINIQGGPITFANEGFVTNNATGQTLTISSVIAGGGTSMTFTNANITGTNTYGGATIINGTHRIDGIANGGSNSELGSSSAAAGNLIFNDGAVLRYDGTSGTQSTDRDFRIDGTTAQIYVRGNGNLTWNGTASYGTANQATTLTLNSSDAVTGDGTFAGVLADNGSGQLSLRKIGTSQATESAWTLSNANTFTGSTTIAAGVLILTNVNALQYSYIDTAGSVIGSTTAGLFNNGASALNIGGLSGDKDLIDIFQTGVTNYAAITGITLNVASANNLSYSGGIGGARALTKTGAGTQTMSGSLSYSGATQVTGGTLAINGTLSGTSSVTVSNTATLQGSGSINSSVTIEGGGILASGNSIESLATGTLNLEANSTFAYEIDRSEAATVAGDLTAVTGALNLALTDDSILTIDDIGMSGSWSYGDKLTLISYSGAWNGGLFEYLSNPLADDSTFTYSGTDWVFNYNDTVAGTNFVDDLTGSAFVTMTAIPEPGAALLGSLGLLALLRRRRA